MQRVIVSAGALLLFSSLVQSPVMEQRANAQDTSAQATIEALQTRVAELEQQIGLTPTPAVDESAPAASERRTQLTIAGTALTHLPAGDTESLEVIATGPYMGYLPVVIRNNSKVTRDDITVSVAVRSPYGSLLASGSSIFTHPYRLRSGQVAFTEIPLDDVALPPNAIFDVSLESKEAGATGASFSIDLEVVDASKIDDRIVGEVRNTSGVELNTVQMLGMCFDVDGRPSGTFLTGLDPDTLSPFASGTFQSNARVIARECTTFLVAVRGSRL